MATPTCVRYTPEVEVRQSGEEAYVAATRVEGQDVVGVSPAGGAVGVLGVARAGRAPSRSDPSSASAAPSMTTSPPTATTAPHTEPDTIKALPH